MKSIKRSKKQYARWLILWSVILFFIWIPYSNWYANNKISYNQARLVSLSEGEVKARLYFAMDKFYSLWDDPVTAATGNNGSLWAFTIFGVPLSDPVGLISELINSVLLPVKYLLGGLIPFFLVLVLGRFFCAWLCPMALLFSFSRKIREFLIKIKFPLLEWKLEPRTRVFMFWGGLILSYILGAWVWHYILPYIALTQDMFSYVIFGTLSVGSYFIIALVVLDIALLPGEYCKSVCPTGFLLSWLGQWSLYRLVANRSKCPKNCSKCMDVCPMNLFPKEGRLYSCDLCLKCMDNCPMKHIKFKRKSLC